MAFSYIRPANKEPPLTCTMHTLYPLLYERLDGCARDAFLWSRLPTFSVQTSLYFFVTYSLVSFFKVDMIINKWFSSATIRPYFISN